MDSNMTLSDIAAVTGGNNAFGGNGGFFWIFALLMLFWGGNGAFGYGNRADGRCATVEDINNSANFTRLENQVGNIGAMVERKADGISNGICSLGYEIAQQFGNTNMAMATGFGNVKYDTLAQTSALSNQISECCCANKQLLMENRYLNSNEMANQTAQILAGIQSVKDQIAGDKIAALQEEVQTLKTQNMFCGIPRISNYAYGVYPYATGCNCNGNGNI